MQLVRKAKLLPFAADKIIMPVLFLKNKPLDYDEFQKDDDGGSIVLPKDIMKLS